MLILSFAKTLPELLADKKDMTRRVWCDRQTNMFIRAYSRGDLVQAYNKNPRNGGKPVGFILMTKQPYLQKLGDMPESDLDREGGKWDKLEDFWDEFPCDLDWKVVVIEFKFYPLVSL